jgi:hypothetical protein
VQQGDGAQRVVVALLPHQPAGRDDGVLVRRRRRRDREALRVDARSGDDDALLVDALEQQREAGALGRGEEQVGLGEHDLAVARGSRVAVRAQQRQRLPHRLHEAEAVTLLAARGVGGEPVAELLGVDDVGRGVGLVGARGVAVARPEQHRHVADQTLGQPVAPRSDRHGRQLERRRVIGVGRGAQVRDIEALRERLPLREVPRRDLMAADDQHLRHGARR